MDRGQAQDLGNDLLVQSAYRCDAADLWQCRTAAARLDQRRRAEEYRRSVDYIASRVWADEQAATRRALFSSRSSEFSPLAQSRKPMHDPEVMSRLAAMAESSARLAMMDRHSSTICRLPGTRGDPP